MRQQHNLVLFLLAFVPSIAQAADETLGTAEKAVAVLNNYCYRCHGAEFKYPGLDILDRATLIDPKDEQPYLVPGQADKSRIWQKMSAADPADRMPPENQPQPSKADIEIVRQWIASGAVFPLAKRQVREYRGEDTILEAIARDLQDLQKVSPVARQYTRYFSLLHLSNDPNLSDSDLRLVRAAVSKLMNSLSREHDIKPPRLVDADGLVMAIDLRHYGWHKGNQWHALLEEYPFGLKRGTAEAQRVYDLTLCDLPYLRADWFVYHASRPPLYHQILGLPKGQKSLESELGVNFVDNFKYDLVARSAFRRSGVSDHNRMVQRQSSRDGAYWDSYDAKSDTGENNYFSFPLGPVIEGSKVRSAFKHDGGEMIFHLPNGLIGFYLAKANGERIDEGPIEIVRDPQQFSGSNKIVNGISCMGCHKQGFLPLHDTLRAGYEKLRGQDVADKVLRIFPLQDDMNKLLEKDRDRYLTALDAAVLPFLRSGADDNRRGADFSEPITHVARRYDRKLLLDDIVRELLLPTDDKIAEQLKLPTPADLKSQLRLNNEFQAMGLEPLVRGEIITRAAWERTYHQAAFALNLGVPRTF